MLEVKFQYLLGYPSILFGYTSNNHVFMPSIGSLCVGSFYLFIFLSCKRSGEKWRFQALKSLLLPQFSTYRHRTRFIVKRKQVLIKESLWQNYKLLKKNLHIFKVVYFAKNTCISRILWGVGFSMSAQKHRFIFYNSFSLRLTENLHEQKHFLKTRSTCFVNIIVL